MRNLPAVARRITPANEHWFFGYYDIPAFDSDCKRHLCLKVPFMDRMNEKDDTAELYCIDLESGERTQIGETTAWNFQQACMLQWHPTQPDTVIYNLRCGDAEYPERTNSGYGAIVKNLSTGENMLLDAPVANVVKTGDWAVSINFDRMYDFRPGYGYAGQRDRFYDIPHPDNDGIFLIDMHTGKSRLIVSLQRIWEFIGDYFGGDDKKICINHITFNTNGTRIVFLVRNFRDGKSGWKTAILTCDTQGEELFRLSDFGYASHYHWRDPHTVTFHSGGAELGDLGPQLYELNDLTHTGRAIDTDFFVRDGHNSYSPDLEWMLYDSYPINGKRDLYLYDLVTKRGGLLGKYEIVPYSVDDIRCDLHPVWRPDGKAISFDSVHEGFRGLYTMDVQDAMKSLREG